MEILSDKIIKFTNAFSPNGYIDLIEDVSSSCYPLNSVERRPHLTMELPFLFSQSDNISAIKLRSRILKDIMDPISRYMSVYGISKMVPKKDFITVSKLEDGRYMDSHVDDDQVDSDNFICMAYINDNFSGGDLVFPDINLSYSPSAGDIILYQSKQKHMVNKISGGPRYSFGYGFKGPINDTL